MPKGKGVPDRWEDYSNIGRQIPGTRFICFKVPLRKGLISLESRGMNFTPDDLVENCTELGMVIDLTNTTRYYDPKEITQDGILHRKINTEGHIVPSNSVVHQFFRTVEEFLEKNKHNERLIGVHCTHGVNRTGYLVCRYMIQRLGVPPDQAIIDFGSARGHELERVNYLEDLRRAPWKDEPIYANSPSQRSPMFNGPRMAPRKYYSPDRDRDTDTPNSWSSWRNHHGSSSNNLQGNWRNHHGSSSHTPEGNWRTNMSPGRYEDDSSPYSRYSRREGNTPSPRYSSGDKWHRDIQPHPPLLPSPRVAKSYYEEYYRGPVQPQYDRDFYQSQGTGTYRRGGYGPQRPTPRNPPSDPTRPRQYRGPRAYRSPEKEEEPLPSYRRDSYSHEDRPRLANVPGPSRNPLSPGVAGNIFSPDNNSRRIGRRFQPY